jgi:uncharacterized protein (DUF58 family)
MDAKAILEKIKLLEIKTKHLSKQVFSGEYHAAFKGRGMTFSEVRNYQTGDEIRTIDWNVTARFNEPFVKVFDEEREINVQILVDISKSNDYGITQKSKKELVLELAAVLSFSAIANNDKVGTIFYSDIVEKFVPSQKGRKHVLYILRELSEWETKSKGTNLSSAVRYFQNTSKNRSIVFVISDFIDEPNTLENLARLRKRHDVVAIKVTDPIEQNFPKLGLIPMENNETGEVTWVNSSSKEFQEEYLEQFNSKSEKWANELKKKGIDAVEISTTDDYYHALVELFHKRRA